MTVSKYDILEFSRVYKRVMDIELCLKACFSNSLSIVASNKRFYRLLPAFNDPKIFEISKYNYKKFEKGNKVSRNRINDIKSSSKTDDEKFNEFIKIAYLSDILSLITEYYLIHKNPKFCCNFYTQKVLLDDVKKYSSSLKKLRNIIMHFDIINYKNNKISYIEALAFWETQLHCKNCFIHDLPPVIPTIKNILKLIKSNYPDLFEENDRQIVDIFDDIAFINGLPVEKLPQYWSIGRQIYLMKNKCD